MQRKMVALLAMCMILALLGGAGIAVGGAALPAHARSAAEATQWAHKPFEAPFVAAPLASTTSVTTPVNAVFLPVITYNGDPAQAPSLFGFQLYGDTGSSRDVYPYLMESGAEWVRVNVSWRSVEPENTTPDEYNWSPADNAAGAARDGGLNVIITHEHAPEWAATDENGVIDRAPLSELAEYLAAMAERYDGDGVDDASGSPVVNYFEIYNEPDRGPSAGGLTKWGAEGAAYAEMLSVVTPAIKEANPNARILLGGLAYDWWTDVNGPFIETFIDDVLENGGGDHFDIVNLHYYAQFDPNWTTTLGPGLYGKTIALQAKLNEYGYDKPTMITESGMHSDAAEGYDDGFRFEMTPELQARYVVELFAQALAADVSAMTWFTLRDLPEDWYPLKTGLVCDKTADPASCTFASDSNDVANYAKKPAFTTYQVMMEEMDTAHFDRVLTTAETGDDNLEVYRFVDYVADRITYIAWLNPIDTEEVAPLAIPAAQATLKDIYGASSSASDADDGATDGRVTVQVGGQPVYIQLSR